MTTGSALLVNATRRLREAGVEDPARDARVLLAHALGVERGRLTLVLPDEVAGDVAAAFDRAVAARANRQPVAQIVGTRAFHGYEFIVTPDVLDPRPDTELLVDSALNVPFDSVLDLGTGSGCILLTLLAERPNARGLGVDLSAAALAVAKKNAAALQVAQRVTFCEGSWFDPLPGDARFDLIVSNPPYITDEEMDRLSPEVCNWEPHIALSPGGDGLAAYRLITDRAPRFLAPEGWLMVEIGALQSGAVQQLFREAGFQKVQLKKDLSGHDRVVAGQWVSATD